VDVAKFKEALTSTCRSPAYNSLKLCSFTS